MARTEDFNVGLWSDPEFEPLSADAALLYIWSWTNTHTNWAGLYTVGRGTIALQSKVPADRLDAALEELRSIGWLHYEDGVLWVRGRVKNIRSKSRRMAVSVARDVARVRPDHPLRAAWMDRYGRDPWLTEALTEVFGHHPGTFGEVHDNADPVGKSLNHSNTSTEPSEGFHRTRTGTRGRTATAEGGGNSARGVIAAVADQNALPADMPEHLAAVAVEAHAKLGALNSMVCRNGAKPPTLYLVGMAVRDFPNVDHLQKINDIEAWILGRPELVRQGRTDLAARFRQFCENASRPKMRVVAGGAADPRPLSAAELMAAEREGRIS